MKTFIHLSRRSLLISASLAVALVFAGSELASGASKKSPTPTQTAQAPGRLIINRSATLGPTIVGLRIDGKETAKITFNRSYNAPLAAGEHVLTLYPLPSLEGAKPTDKRLTVEPGKTYTFTAARNDIQLVLK